MLQSAFINDFFPDQESNEGKIFQCKRSNCFQIMLFSFFLFFKWFELTDYTSLPCNTLEHIDAARRPHNKREDASPNPSCQI